MEIPGRYTHFMTSQSPDDVMTSIEEYCQKKSEEEEIKVLVDESTYKAKIINQTSGVELAVRIS